MLSDSTSTRQSAPFRIFQSAVALLTPFNIYIKCRKINLSLVASGILISKGESKSRLFNISFSKFLYHLIKSNHLLTVLIQKQESRCGIEINFGGIFWKNPAHIRMPPELIFNAINRNFLGTDFEW
ncbi:hypothetical protein C2R22_05700 [Salinigranum rubrum]|uniref:Uncharacterized protein n=1 Tax=Salinigranum rubrum TaxID=755307 RepID=A0A2I8VH09_9EURY|nr:hypothetical protein C2R22_05700 [Salinigranum rubrum]